MTSTSSDLPMAEHGTVSLRDLETASERDLHSSESKKTLVHVSVSKDVSPSPASTDLDLVTVEKVVKPKPIEHGPAPEPLRGERYSRFRYVIFTVYHRVFTIVFTLNAVALVALMVCTNGRPSLSSISAASSANLLGTILARQEDVVNKLYEVVCWTPHWVPLSIRSRLANVFHYGGIHSGCGTSAAMWYLLQTVLITLYTIEQPRHTMLPDVIVSWLLCIFLITIILAAHPNFRVRYHNQFEMLHRFAGWLAICGFWAHTVMAVREKHSSSSFGKRLVSTPSFWLLIITTSCTILSWSRLRLRKVTAERLSNHALRLHFHYKDMPPFYGVKISTNPVCEWHAFATIPNQGPKGSGFSVLISNAGDWTDNLIKNPPSEVWVRGLPLHAVSFTSTMFKRTVAVATGTGIGPLLSMFAAQRTPVRVIWSTPNPEVTFGQKIIDEIRAADPNAIIWNSREHGRPDLVAVTCQLVKDFDAEAVFCISNPKVTWNLISEMKRRKIPAYSPIFDS